MLYQLSYTPVWAGTWPHAGRESSAASRTAACDQATALVVAWPLRSASARASATASGRPK
jgi:hypothetical protein